MKKQYLNKIKSTQKKCLKTKIGISILLLTIIFIGSSLAFGRTHDMPKNNIMKPKDIITMINMNDHTVVNFHASWCGNCILQERALKKINQNQSFSSINFVQVNYDKHTKLRKMLDVPSPSTIIIFQKGKEIARTVGLTQQTALEMFIKRGEYLTP